MVINRRTAAGHRVQFGRPLTATIMGIDGTWKRDCVIVDVSNDGAKLQVDGGLNGLNVKEFLLASSGSGQTHRRCEMPWCRGTEVGVKFIRASARKKGSAAAAGREEARSPAEAAKSVPGSDAPRGSLVVIGLLKEFS
jgi:PilZ domain